MDLNRLKNMVAAAKERSDGNNSLIWKPAPGLNTIRAVPYYHDPDMPFTELRVHYNEVSKKPILSPSTPCIGKEDPILEFGIRLQEEANGNTEVWVRGKKLEPKSRYYLPIIVRGHEHEGVKFWGFGANIFNMLYAKITNPKWGDFTDPVEGRDIDVTYVKPTPTNKYGDTIIDVSPEKSPVTSDRAVLEMIKDMPKVESLFKLHTYEELEQILADYIAKGTAVIPDGANDNDDGGDYDEENANTSTSTTHTHTDNAANTETYTESRANVGDDDLKKAFNDIFKKKTN